MFEFVVVENKKLIDGLGVMTVFGVAMRGEAGEITRIADISSLKERAEQFQRLCLKGEVSTSSFFEVAEDFIVMG